MGRPPRQLAQLDERQRREFSSIPAKAAFVDRPNFKILALHAARTRRDSGSSGPCPSLPLHPLASTPLSPYRTIGKHRASFWWLEVGTSQLIILSFSSQRACPRLWHMRQSSLAQAVCGHYCCCGGGGGGGARSCGFAHCNFNSPTEGISCFQPTEPLFNSLPTRSLPPLMPPASTSVLMGGDDGKRGWQSSGKLQMQILSRGH